MDKYTILVILNLPFVLFGLVKSVDLYNRRVISQVGLVLRVIFWLGILAALLFAQPIYNFLASNNLTNSPPISLVDVVLVTGLNFALALCIRLYSRLDTLERRVSGLHERLSIVLSSGKEGVHKSKRKL